MKNNIHFFILLPAILASCATNGGTNCVSMDNYFQEDFSSQSPILVANGKENLSKGIYINKKVDVFKLKLTSYLNNIDTPKHKLSKVEENIQYCKRINNALYEANPEIKNEKLKKIENSWSLEYKEFLNQHASEIKTIPVNGCENSADSLFDAYIKKLSGEIDNNLFLSVEHVYNQCLTANSARQVK